MYHFKGNWITSPPGATVENDDKFIANHDTSKNQIDCRIRGPASKKS